MLPLWASMVDFTSKCKRSVFAQHTRPTQMYLSMAFWGCILRTVINPYPEEAFEGCLHIYLNVTFHKPVCMFISRRRVSSQLWVQQIGVIAHDSHCDFNFGPCYSLFFFPQLAETVRIIQSCLKLSFYCWISVLWGWFWACVLLAVSVGHTCWINGKMLTRHKTYFNYKQMTILG